MFTHMFLGSNDIERSRRFYDATMAALGYENLAPAGGPRLVYRGPAGTLVVAKPRNGNAATAANGATLGLAAPDDATVDAWHAAGLANGGTCEGPPGPREDAPNHARGAYLRDPDNNKICCFHMTH